MRLRMTAWIAVAAVLGQSAIAADFPVDPARLADAKALVGKSCTKMFDDAAKVFPGYTTPKGFVNVVMKTGFVTPKEKGGARFAFLIIYGDEVSKSCTIADVVALPDAKHANAFLQCDADMVYGFGMRLAGHPETVGFWSAVNDKLVRQPPGKVHCQEPESGE